MSWDLDTSAPLPVPGMQRAPTIGRIAALAKACEAQSPAWVKGQTMQGRQFCCPECGGFNVKIRDNKTSAEWKRWNCEICKWSWKMKADLQVVRGLFLPE